MAGSRPVPGHTITNKLVSADTGGAYSVLEVLLEGDGPPQHIHKTEDEAFYVLEGELTILLGDRTFTPTTGSFVFIRRGTVHAWARTGEQPVKILAIIAPAGLEQFFAEAVDTGGASTTDEFVAQAEALAEKYNMEIVGPPLEPGSTQ